MAVHAPARSAKNKPNNGWCGATWSIRIGEKDEPRKSSGSRRDRGEALLFGCFKLPDAQLDCALEIIRCNAGGQARSCIKEKTPVVAREPALVARLAVAQEVKRLNEPFKLRTQGTPLAG